MEKSICDGKRSARARQQREFAVSDMRRALILDAARAAFFELGLEGASLREIARRAGYTPGALYTYFASKEEIYGALLAESLERLNASVAAAVASAESAEARLGAGARAFFAFYSDHPRDLDLGFYLFHGVRPMGLTLDLDARLNARLRDALAPMQVALEQLGMRAPDAERESAALFAHMVGLLILSHTGRIRMFGQDPSELLERYLAGLRARQA